MKYDIIFSVAADAIRNKVSAGTNILPDDTVCVLITNTDKTYTGFNPTAIKDGKLVAGCSEKEAVKNLLADNDNIGVVSAMITMNCSTMIPVLPCKTCVELITGINSENTNTLVISPDKKYIRITDVDKYKYGGDNSEIESIDELLLSDPLIVASPINNEMNAGADTVRSPFIHNNIFSPMQYYPDHSTQIIQQQVPVNSPSYEQFGGIQYQQQADSGYQPQYSGTVANIQYQNQQYTSTQYSDSLQYRTPQFVKSPYITSQYINSQYTQNNQYSAQIQSGTHHQFIPDFTPSDDDNDESDLLQDKLNDLLKSGYDD